MLKASNSVKKVLGRFSYKEKEEPSIKAGWYFPRKPTNFVRRKFSKLPVKERLFRIGVKHDPYCLKFSGAEVHDIVHYFCTCEAVCNTWDWLKGQVVCLGHMKVDVEDWGIVNLLFLK